MAPLPNLSGDLIAIRSPPGLHLSINSHSNSFGGQVNIRVQHKAFMLVPKHTRKFNANHSNCKTTIRNTHEMTSPNQISQPLWEQLSNLVHELVVSPRLPPMSFCMLSLVNIYFAFSSNHRFHTSWYRLAYKFISHKCVRSQPEVVRDQWCKVYLCM